MAKEDKHGITRNERLFPTREMNGQNARFSQLSMSKGQTKKIIQTTDDKFDENKQSLGARQNRIQNR